jgi:hypothetical protein
MKCRLPALIVCALVALALVGCSAKAPGGAETPAPSADAPHVAPESTVQPIGGVSEMPAQQKTAELNSEFVTEWPVVAGKVISADSPDGAQLRFVLSVNASAAAVEQWYRAVMEGRAFILSEDLQTSSGGVVLKYSRAGLRYVVEIEPEGDKDSQVVGTITSGAGAL